MKTRFVLSFVAFLIPIFSYASNHIQQVQNPYNITLQFFQELDTKKWRLSNGLVASEGPWKFKSDGYGELLLRQLPGYEPHWQDDIVIDMHAVRDINKNLNVILETSGQTHHDRRASLLGSGRSLGNVQADKYSASILPVHFLNETGSQVQAIGSENLIQRASSRAGIEWTDGDKLKMRLLAGSSWDKQEEGEGNGPSGRVGISFEGEEEKLPRIDSDFRIDNYDDRRNQNTSVRSSFEKKFGDAINVINVSWMNYRTDDFGALGSIEPRIQDEVYLDNRLATPIATGVTSMYELSIQRKSVSIERKETDRSYQQNVSHKLSMNWTRDRLRGQFFYLYEQDDTDYNDLILGRHNGIGGNLTYSSGMDSLSLRYSTRKERDDSPNRENVSDHLIHSINLSGLSWITPETKANLDITVFLDHLVYLDSKRSANNRWNRVFVINPEIEWNPAEGWKNKSEFIVLANYTTYDFEEPNSSEVISTAFRRWSAADTLQMPIYNEWYGEISFRYDLEDRGRFNWSKFTQDVSDEWNARFFSFAMGRFFWRRLNLKVGYHFEQRIDDRIEYDSNREQIKLRVRNYKAEGPTFRLKMESSERFRWYAEGKLLKVENSQQDTSYRLDTIYMSVSYLW